MKHFIRRLFFFFLILACLGLVCVGTANIYMTQQTKARIASLAQAEAPASPVDAIFVLGCGVNAQGQPSPLLQHRLDTAIALYQKGWSKKIIMSGDHGRTAYDEVNTMKNYAIAHGVPTEDIFMDHAGFSTYESIYRARDVFQVRHMVIVSQAYHLNRALFISDRLGLSATSVAAPTRPEGQRAREMREWLARTKEIVQCAMQPKPTHLGPTIDLSGSGDVTNDGKTASAQNQ